MRRRILALHNEDPRSQEDLTRLVHSLRRIERGERITYFTGVSLSTCNAELLSEVRRLTAQGRIIPHQRRVRPPMHNGELESRQGIGAFEYLAVGR